MHEIIHALRHEADVIVVDSPPVLSVAGASLLANRLDATLLVVDAETTSVRAARRAVKQLRQAGANLLGCVLQRPNRADGDGSD